VLRLIGRAMDCKRHRCDLSGSEVATPVLEFLPTDLAAGIPLTEGIERRIPSAPPMFQQPPHARRDRPDDHEPADGPSATSFRSCRTPSWLATGGCSGNAIEIELDRTWLTL